MPPFSSSKTAAYERCLGDPRERGVRCRGSRRRRHCDQGDRRRPLLAVVRPQTARRGRPPGARGGARSPTRISQVIVMTAYGTVEDAVSAMKKVRSTSSPSPWIPTISSCFWSARSSAGISSRKTSCSRRSSPSGAGSRASSAKGRADRRHAATFRRRHRPTRRSSCSEVGHRQEALRPRRASAESAAEGALHRDRAPRSPRRCSRTNCSGTEEPSPERTPRRPAAWRWPTVARSSWMRSATSRRRCKAKLLRVLQDRTFERVGGDAEEGRYAHRRGDQPRSPAEPWPRALSRGPLLRLAVVTVSIPPLRGAARTSRRWPSTSSSGSGVSWDAHPPLLGCFRRGDADASVARQRARARERRGARRDPARRRRHRACGPGPGQRALTRRCRPLDLLGKAFDLTGTIDEIATRIRDRVERALIEQALEQSAGNKTRAAEQLGINYKRLPGASRELGLED